MMSSAALCSRMILHRHLLYTVHCPLSIVHRPLSIVHRPLSILHRPLYTVHCPLYICHLLKVGRKLNSNRSTRLFSSDKDRIRRGQWGNKSGRNRDVVMYSTAGVLVALAASYAAVPLYRIYCQSTGKGGKAVVDSESGEKVASMKTIRDRKVKVRFEADTSSQIAWDFKPTVREIVVSPGETALAFYTATNPTTRPVTGISTYSVMPYEAGLYLNKIQCFCFEEQRLNPKEEVSHCNIN